MDDLKPHDGRLPEPPLAGAPDLGTSRTAGNAPMFAPIHSRDVLHMNFPGMRPMVGRATDIGLGGPEMLVVESSTQVLSLDQPFVVKDQNGDSYEVRLHAVRLVSHDNGNTVTVAYVFVPWNAPPEKEPPLPRRVEADPEEEAAQPARSNRRAAGTGFALGLLALLLIFGIVRMCGCGRDLPPPAPNSASTAIPAASTSAVSSTTPANPVKNAPSVTTKNLEALKQFCQRRKDKRCSSMSTDPKRFYWQEGRSSPAEVHKDWTAELQPFLNCAAVAQENLYRSGSGTQWVDVSSCRFTMPPASSASASTSARPAATPPTNKQ